MIYRPAKAAFVQIYRMGCFHHLQRCRGCGINLLGRISVFKELNRKIKCSEKGKLREIGGRKAEDLSPAHIPKRGYGEKQNKIARLPKQRRDNARMPVAAKFRRGQIDTGIELMKWRPVGVFALECGNLLRPGDRQVFLFGRPA